MKRLLILFLVFISLVGVYLAHSTLQPNNKPINKDRGNNMPDSGLVSYQTGSIGDIPYVGPYSPAVYQTVANQGATGSAGYVGPYSPETYGLADSLTGSNSFGGTTGAGGGTGGTTYGTQTTDPYAKYGGQSAYNNLVSGFNTQKQNIYGTANDAAANQGYSLKNNILDFVQGLRTGQRGIDQQATNNELAKRQGVSGILGMVGRGIRSSGVTLANKNAGDSSAAGAIANAYGQYGRGQMANIGNQYAQGQNAVQLAQANLGDQQAAGTRRLSDSKTQVVNGIVADARDKFAQLDASMVNASMPDRIAIEQEKENVRQQVLGQLQQYDQLLADETSKITPTSQDARMTEAARLQNAGTDLGANAFQYSTQTPSQFQNTGPFASELPLFTYRGNKQLA